MNKILHLFLAFVFINTIYASELNTNPTRIKKYQDVAKENIQNFYSDISNLMDNSITDYNLKNEERLSIISTFFEDDTKFIGNDLKELGFNQDTYQINDYLTKCMSVNGNQNEREVLIDVKNITISPLYKNPTKSEYLFVATFDRTLTVNDEIYNEKPVTKEVTDKLMMKLITENGNDFKIDQFSKATKYNPAKEGYVEITPSETKISTNSQIPYFVFNIQPANAKIEIDGVEVDYANGEKIPTKEGFHTVVITAPKYKSKTLQPNVRGIELKQIDATLEKKKGILEIKGESSEVEGAKIIILPKGQKSPIDDLGELTIPTDEIELEDGMYDVRITKECYFKVQKSVKIIAGTTSTLLIKKLTSKNSTGMKMLKKLGAFAGAIINNGKCPACGGNGVCGHCHGNNSQNCCYCNGTGKCTACKGTGIP